MKDFTFDMYKELLEASRSAGYCICCYQKFLTRKIVSKRIIILRHDVDKSPLNSLKTAKLENELGIQATYYFRISKRSFNKNIVKDIAKLGHEIGYHYEDLAKAEGNYQRAIYSFEINLNKLRQFYPVNTICMHGSPLSRWDNLLLWEKYDYKDYGIIGEPFFDIKPNELLYLTDTGRKWNCSYSNLRDLIDAQNNINIKSTQELIDVIKREKLPKKLMINTHPQRWSNETIFWYKEFVFQNFKNVIKRLIKTYGKRH